MKNPHPFSPLLSLAFVAFAFSPVGGIGNELISVATDGTAGDAPSHHHYCSISGDGRLVAFLSEAGNFDPGDNNMNNDVYLRDRLHQTTIRLSVGLFGADRNAAVTGARISNDGKFAAFWSKASNLVGGDVNGSTDIFVYDRLADRLFIASCLNGTNNPVGGGTSTDPVLSSDGKIIAFLSRSPDLTGQPDTNNTHDILVRDLSVSPPTTTRVSLTSDGNEITGGGASEPTISDDGRYVAYVSSSPSVVPADINGSTDVFVFDRTTQTTTRASVTDAEANIFGDSTQPSLSGDGRYLVFKSDGGNLGVGHTHGAIILRDRVDGTTQIVSVGTAGQISDAESWVQTDRAISSDGRYVVFGTTASNLDLTVNQGGEGIAYSYVRDLVAGETLLLGEGTQPTISANGVDITIQGDTVGQIRALINPFIGARPAPWTPDPVILTNVNLSIGTKRSFSSKKKATIKVRGKKTARYYLHLRNDGNGPDGFRLRSNRPNKKLVRAKVFDPANRNITAAIWKSGVSLAEVGSGQHSQCRCQLKGRGTHRKRQTLNYTLSSGNDASKTSRSKALVRTFAQ